MVGEPGADEFGRVRMRRDEVGDFLLRQVRAVSVSATDRFVRKHKRVRYNGTETHFRWFGSLTS